MDEKDIYRGRMDEKDIYKDVGKWRWPYVDAPRPKPPGRRGTAGMPAEPGPRPIPLTP